MAYRWAVVWWIAAVAIALTWAPVTFVQRGQSVEELLQARAAQSQLLQPHFELAVFYYSVRRYDDFDRTLSVPQSIVRKAQAKARPGEALTVPTATVKPKRVGPGFPVPMKLREVRPIYPREALEQRTGGIVELEITIDTRGLVSDARVARSAAGLDDAALFAVRQWEFAPSFEEGSVIPVVMDLRLTFIPETIITVPQTWRRQVGAVLMLAESYYSKGAFAQAAHVLDVVLAASQRERAEPAIPAHAVAAGTGVTTSAWPIRGGRDLKFPEKTRDAKVVYPSDALQARTGGMVAFDFVIDEHGKPTSLRQVVSPSPVLEQAGRAAIEQWEYVPTVIGGTAVPVAMTITFAFQADRGVVEEVLRVGGIGNITEPKKTRHVPPRYPEEAQRKRIQGTVVIEAVIDKAGKVGSMSILRSAGELLDNAALEAVRQWEFTPTMVYGEPADVVMTITVNFSLN